MAALSTVRYRDNDKPLVAELDIASVAFSGFTAGEGREESMGITSSLDAEEPFTMSEGEDADGNIMFGIRHDKRRVPATALRRRCKEVQDELKSRFGRDKLTRMEREQIKEKVLREMIEAVPPATTFAVCTVSPRTGEAVLFSTNAAISKAVPSILAKLGGWKAKRIGYKETIAAFPGSSEEEAKAVDGGFLDYLVKEVAPKEAGHIDVVDRIVWMGADQKVVLTGGDCKYDELDTRIAGKTVVEARFWFLGNGNRPDLSATLTLDGTIKSIRYQAPETDPEDEKAGDEGAALWNRRAVAHEAQALVDLYLARYVTARRG